MAALEDAFRAEPGLPLARCAEAWLKTLSARDWKGARRGFEEVLEESPSCARAMSGRALLYIAEQRPEAASELLLRAAQRTPLSSVPLELYSWSKYLSGDFAGAIEQVQEARAAGHSGPIFDAVESLVLIRQEDPRAKIDRVEALAASSPQCSVPWGVLGYMHAVHGKHRQAREILARMTSSSTDALGREPYAAALLLIGLDEWRQAVDCLERSYRNGSLWSLGFRSDSILEALRTDPSHMRFFSKLSYPEAEKLDPEAD
jgi:tetratricopeptide (TPR) repeat protein